MDKISIPIAYRYDNDKYIFKFFGDNDGDKADKFLEAFIKTSILDTFNVTGDTYALYDQQDKLSKITLNFSDIRGVVCSNNSSGASNDGKKIDCVDTLVT